MTAEMDPRNLEEIVLGTRAHQPTLEGIERIPEAPEFKDTFSKRVKFGAPQLSEGIALTGWLSIDVRQASYVRIVYDPESKQWFVTDQGKGKGWHDLNIIGTEKKKLNKRVSTIFNDEEVSESRWTRFKSLKLWRTKLLVLEPEITFAKNRASVVRIVCDVRSGKIEKVSQGVGETYRRLGLSPKETRRFTASSQSILLRYRDRHMRKRVDLLTGVPPMQ